MPPARPPRRRCAPPSPRGCEIGLLMPQLAFAAAENAAVPRASSQRPATVSAGGGPRGRRGAPRQQVRLMRLDHQEEQQRVPERELEAGPVRAEERDADDLDGGQEAEGARGAAGESHHRREVDPVEEESAVKDAERRYGDFVRGRRASRSRRRGRRGSRSMSQVTGTVAIAGQIAVGRHDDGPQAQPEGREVLPAIDDRQQLGGIRRRARVVPIEGPWSVEPGDVGLQVGARASLGSFLSRRSWIRTNPTAASRSTRTIARLLAARAAVSAIRCGSPGCSPAGPLAGAIEVP